MIFFKNIYAGYPKPQSSPFHGSIQEVEESLKHHMVACFVWVMELGSVQGNGRPRRIPYTLEYTHLETN